MVVLAELTRTPIIWTGLGETQRLCCQQASVSESTVSTWFEHFVTAEAAAAVTDDSNRGIAQRCVSPKNGIGMRFEEYISICCMRVDSVDVSRVWFNNFYSNWCNSNASITTYICHVTRFIGWRHQRPRACTLLLLKTHRIGDTWSMSQEGNDQSNALSW
jgi:hypothetical protein